MTMAAETQEQKMVLVETKIDEKHLASIMKKLGVRASGTPAHRAQVLWQKFLKQVADDKTIEMLECENCQGESPSTLDVCPYCGIKEGESSESTEEETKVAVVEKMSTKLVPSKANKTNLRVVSDDEEVSTEFGEEDLDKAIVEVQKCKAGSAQAWWDLGQKISHIIDNRLWKLRRKEDGSPLFKTFESFCNAELQISPQNALMSRDCSQNFSRDQLAAAGIKRCQLKLKAPAEMRDEIQKDIESGISTRELARKVRDANKGKPIVERGGKVRSRPEKTRPSKSVKESKVSDLIGAHKIDLWKKPTRFHKLLNDLENQARARKLNDYPSGVLPLGDDTYLFFTIDADAAGDLIARVKIEKREDAQE